MVTRIVVSLMLIACVASAQVPHRRTGNMAPASTTAPFGTQLGRFPVDSASAVSYKGRTPFVTSITTGLILPPPAAAANDLMILIWHGRGNTDATQSATWTVLTEANAGANLRIGVYYRISDGNASKDTARITGGSNGQMACILKFGGVNTSTPFNAWTQKVYAADYGAPDIRDIPDFATTVDSCLIVWIVASSDDNTWGNQGGWARVEAVDSLQTAGTPDTSFMVAYNGKTQRGGIRGLWTDQTALGFDPSGGVLIALQPD